VNKLNIFVALIFVLFIGTALASCTVNIDNANLEIRTNRENVYSSNISAEDNDKVDVKISFDITTVDGTTCPSTIEAYAKIYHWNTTSGSWVLDKTISKQNSTLNENPLILLWNDILTINDNYERYKVEAFIGEGTNYEEILEANIDVQDNSCSGIDLVISNFTIDEGENQTKYFRIENNTNTDFDISDVQILFTTGIVSSGSVDYPDQVDRYSTENVDVTLNPNYVSTNTTTTGTFAVSGYLGSTFCSSSAVGKKTFEVTVRDTGANNNGNTGSGTSSDCDDLEIHTKNITVGEGQETKEIFYLKNNSTKRFELLDIDTSQNGLEVNGYYYEKYAFPGDVADIVVQAIAPNVTANKTFKNNLEVKGRFSDGKTCNFNDITQGDYDIYITNTSSEVATDCGVITIDVPLEVRIVNAATIPFTIQNNSNQRLDVIVESTLSVDPTIISLAGRTSLSRELFVSTTAPEGMVYLRAQSTCPVQSKTIHVINTATGTLSEVSMTNEIIVDNNIQVLRITFINNTNKAFMGVIKTDINGLSINDKLVTIGPGETIIDIPLGTNNADLHGTVRFITSDQEIASQIGSNNDNDNGIFAGFFGLGFETAAGIGIILVLVIIAIILIATLYEGTRYEEEDQPFVKGTQ